MGGVRGHIFSLSLEMLFFLAFLKIRQKNMGQMMTWLTGF